MDIYFSMHNLKQVASFLDNELPGVGTHFWKQWLFIFCVLNQQKLREIRLPLTHVYELAGVVDCSFLLYLSYYCGLGI